VDHLLAAAPAMVGATLAIVNDQGVGVTALWDWLEHYSTRTLVIKRTNTLLKITYLVGKRLQK